jgi:leader peptidase (prepilin peptidase)/N-methyltransferase
LEGIFASGIGLLTGGGIIYITGLAGNWIFQRESMGGGDVKLLALIGAFLGWEKVLLTFFTAPMIALPFALYRRWVKKEEVIPYGPFLSLAAAVQFFYGSWFWKYFLKI